MAIKWKNILPKKFVQNPSAPSEARPPRERRPKKQPRPWRRFLFMAFFLSLCIGSLMGAWLAYIQMGGSLQFPFSGWYEQAAETLLERSASGGPEQIASLLAPEGKNLEYFILTPEGEQVTNTTAASLPEYQEQFLSQGIWDENSLRTFSHALAYYPQQRELWVENYYAATLRQHRLAPSSGYTYQEPQRWSADPPTFVADPPASQLQLEPVEGEGLLILRTAWPLVPNDGILYRAYLQWELFRNWMAGLLALAAVSFVLAVAAELFHLKTRRQVTASIARGFGKIVLEGKLLLLILCGFGLFGGVAVLEAPDVRGNLFLCLVLTPLAILSLWGLYCLLCDLIHNRSRFFTHNIVTAALNIYRRANKKYPFLKRQLSRFGALVLVELVLVLLCVLVLTLSGYERSFWNNLLPLGCAAAGLYLVWRYYRQLERDMSALEKVIDHVQEMRSGDLDCDLQVDPESDLYPLAQNLNTIQSGLKETVQRQVASERMKVELITNMSHDLKTPLTSIVNYVDLLRKETLSPDYANDYVAVLERKTQRLTTLVQDLFEISKANSKNIDLHLERLDLCQLISQTLAELEERIQQAELDFRVQSDSPSAYVLADGKRLHRVLENLFINAVKYSLPHTRVYLQLELSEETATLTIKNIASYEMDFSPQEIMDRFVRGDKARSSEGSGLGLAIAKSFMEAQNGQLEVVVDGDLFKAILTLPQVEEPEKPPEASQ